LTASRWRRAARAGGTAGFAGLPPGRLMGTDAPPTTLDLDPAHLSHRLAGMTF
jgi:hypothetical protein